MTELPVENKQSVWKIICNFFKKIFTTRNTSCFGLSKTTKKIVIRSRCKESCCCKNCDCVAAVDEKEEDDSSDDIVITADDCVRIA